MPLLSVENLPSDLNILPLLIVKKQGYLKGKRIRKGAIKRKQTRYTNCLQLGYNKKCCVAQPARNRRAERARDWDISSSESNSELERELAPFVEQARAKARAKADGGVRDKEVEVEAPVLPASPASPALQLRPKRARKVPVRYQG
jgi:hypothetical protein